MLEELWGDFKGQQCDHCGHFTWHPTRNHLLSNSGMARLRQQIDGPQDNEVGATLVIQWVQEDLTQLLDMAHSTPPSD